MKSIIALLLFVAPCLASGSGSRITDWMETYYLTKDESRLAEFWDKTAGREALTADVKMREKLVGFFGAVFRVHTSLLKSRIRQVPRLPGVQQDAIALILWWSDQNYSRELLREAGLTTVADLPVPKVSGRGIFVEEDADFLYGWYCATGDTGALYPLARHVEEADWTKANKKTDYVGAMVIYFGGRDLRAWEFFHGFIIGRSMSREAQEVFDKALESKPANQALEPTTLAVMPCAPSRTSHASQGRGSS